MADCYIGDLKMRIAALEVLTARQFPQKLYWESITIAQLLQKQWKQGFMIVSFYFCIFSANLNSVILQTIMNSSSSDLSLRAAVEEQLDLILKMEQQRKVLRQQNKLLHLKLKQSSSIISKYHKQMKNSETNTETEIYSNNISQKELNNKKLNMADTSTKQVQTEQQFQTCNSANPNNFSKLTEAYQLIKQIDSSSVTSDALGRENKSGSLNSTNPKRQVQRNKPKNMLHQQIQKSDKNLTEQMLKLTKQLNILKKQNKELDHRYKLRDKQISDLRKCLQSKSQALQKSKKQFNELSILMNTDKFKSVRTLEAEVQSLKCKLINQEDNSKIKTLLIEMTRQYESYRTEQEKKVDILISELASKQKEIESLKLEVKKLQNR